MTMVDVGPPAVFESRLLLQFAVRFALVIRATLAWAFSCLEPMLPPEPPKGAPPSYQLHDVSHAASLEASLPGPAGARLRAILRPGAVRGDRLMASRPDALGIVLAAPIRGSLGVGRRRPLRIGWLWPKDGRKRNSLIFARCQVRAAR